jgi:hypothetical protein
MDPLSWRSRFSLAGLYAGIIGKRHSEARQVRRLKKGNLND